MTRQAAASLTRIFTVLFLLNPSAFSQTPVRSGTRTELEPMGQHELNQAARKLSSLELRQYTHRSYKLGDKGVPTLDKETAVRTLFLMRPRELMTALPGGFYDDRQGNLIFFGDFALPRKEAIPYSLTFTPASEVILAFDSDRDGVIDGMLGRKPGGNFWELKGDGSSLFWQCLEGRIQAGIFGAAFSCWRGPDSGREGKGRTNPGFGRDPDSFEGFVTGRSNPDCPDFDTGLVRDEPDIAAAVVAEPAAADALLCDSMSDTARGRANETRDAGNEKAAEHLSTGADHLHRAAVAHVHSADPSRSESQRARDDAEYRSERRAYQREVRAARRDGADTRGLALPRAAPQPPARNPPSPVFRPAQPEYKDPRCAGRDKEIKQLGILGLAFNKDFCGDDDPITCLERADDPIRDATQGRCHHKPGPDDSRQLVCEREGHKADAPEPTHGPTDPSDSSEPVRGPADGAPRPFKINGPRVNYTLLEITPLGAILAVRCTAGDGPFCPREGLTKTPGAHP